MANTFNGIGTTFYGQSRFEQDGSFVTTKWFVVGFFPLIPMGSLRVRYLGTSGVPFFARTSSYEVVEETGLDMVQVLKIWLYAVFVITLAVMVLDSKTMNGIAKTIIIAAAMFLPHVLRFLAKRSAG